MRTEIATDKSQSARLLQCGVPAASADMYIDNYDELWAAPFKDNQRKNEKGFAPAWSLSRILELLPSYLEDFPFTKWIEPFGDGEICEKGNESTLSGYVSLYRNETHWIVDYDWDGFTGTLPQSENPIEACVRTIELLHANGYNFNEKSTPNNGAS